MAKTEALFLDQPEAIILLNDNENLRNLMEGKCPDGVGLSDQDQFALARLMVGDIQSGMDSNKQTACHYFEAWAVYLIGFKFENSLPLWRKLAALLGGDMRKRYLNQPMIGKNKKSIEWTETTHEAFFLRCLALKCGKRYASIEEWTKKSGPYPKWIDDLSSDPRKHTSAETKKD